MKPFAWAREVIFTKMKLHKIMRQNYLAPECRIFRFEALSLLCQSGGTEQYGSSGNSYDDDDFN